MDKNTFYRKKFNFESLENGIFGKKYFYSILGLSWVVFHNFFLKRIYLYLLESKFMLSFGFQRQTRKIFFYDFIFSMKNYFSE
jgi:hypothetical protein